jgi:predicted phage terminase large subunit-like protein
MTTDINQSQLKTIELEKLQALEFELYKKARTSFKAFILATFPDYDMNWHHEVVINHLQAFIEKRIKNLIICMPPQHGKLIEDVYPVLTTKGWKRHGDLKQGDYVFHPSGNPVEVVATTNKQKCNAIIHIGNNTIHTHANHMWLTHYKKPDDRVFTTKVVSTSTIIRWLSEGREVRVPTTSQTPQYLNEKPPIEPYLFGLWLTSKKDRKQFTVDFPREHEDFLISLLKDKRIYAKHIASSKNHTHYAIPEFSEFVSAMGNTPKRLYYPFEVLQREHKMELLAGILDGLRCVVKGTQCIAKIAYRDVYLLQDLLSLLSSLGFPVIGTKFNRCSICNEVTFTVVEHIPTLVHGLPVERRTQAQSGKKIDEQPIVTKAELIDSKQWGKCIQVDSLDGLYLIGTDFLVTHNSEIVSRKLPAFLFGVNPDAKIIASSYGSDLIKGFNRDVQRVIQSQEYRRIFPNTKINPKGAHSRESDEINSANRFEIVKHRGFLNSASIQGGISGVPCDIGIIDDAYKDRADAESDNTRGRVWDWYTDAFVARMHNETQQLITMTRWHEDDIVGKLVREQPHNWTVLVLPAIREEDWGYAKDPRKIGEPLWPARHSLEKILAVKEMSPRNFASLQQQRPAPEGGNIIKTQWWRYYDELPEDLQVVVSWDLTFADKVTSDYVVGQVWGRKGPNRYLIDMVRGKWDFLRTITEMKRLRAKYPNAIATLIEEKANGAAAIATLRQTMPGIIAINPTKSKVDRVQAVSPTFEAGCVYVPHTRNNPWVETVIDEATVFPSGRHDDTVDAMTQYLSYVQSRFIDFDIEIGSITKESGRNIYSTTR